VASFHVLMVGQIRVNPMKQTESKAYRQRWIALAFLGISLLIISLDNTVLNVALPSIANDLGASASGLQWVVDAYVLVFASLLLTMGTISDRIGRKKVLQGGLILFGIGSLAAALSNSTETLIGCRAFQGIGAAIIMPSTLSILTATFRDPKERAKAIAIWAGVFGLGMGIGPVIAGVLLDHFHWSSVFFINLPVVAIALIGGYLFMEDSRDERAPRPDIPGVLLSIAGLFALVYGIIKAGEESWTAGDVFYSMSIGVVLLVIFTWWERRTKTPMLPLTFFKNMSFTGANIALTLVMFSMFGSMFFMSQYFQSVQGYTPLQTGLRILPIAPISMVTAINSARVASRIGTKMTVGLGIFLAAVGMLYLSRVTNVNTAYWIVLIGMSIMATGMGTAMSPATNSIMGSLPVRKAGVGSAMNDTTRQVGGALGVAILGTITNTTYLNAVDKLTHNPVPALPESAVHAIRNSIQSAHIVAERIPDPSLSQQIIDTSNKGFVSGIMDAFLVAFIIMLIASLVTLVILPSQVRPPMEE
jgi:EmrB/QacA subfamily drug resistance transporter